MTREPPKAFTIQNWRVQEKSKRKDINEIVDVRLRDNSKKYRLLGNWRKCLHRWKPLFIPRFQPWFIHRLSQLLIFEPDASGIETANQKITKLRNDIYCCWDHGIPCHRIPFFLKAGCQFPHEKKVNILRDEGKRLEGRESWLGNEFKAYITHDGRMKYREWMSSEEKTMWLILKLILTMFFPIVLNCAMLFMS